MKLMKFNIVLCGFLIAPNAFVQNNLNEKMVKRGEVCYKTPENCALNKDLDDIAALLQYFYKEGKKNNQNQDYVSGSFVIKDPGFQIFNKLREFVDNKYPHDMCRERMLTTKSAYPRKSTHFNDLYSLKGVAKKTLTSYKKTNCDYTHYGIDFKKARLGMEKKRHILFGILGNIKGNDLLFIKPEEHGISGSDIFGHTIGLVRSIMQKTFPKVLNRVKQFMNLTTTQNNELKNEFKKMADVATTDISKDTLLINRKERIPADFLGHFLALLLKAQDENLINENDFSRIKKEVKAYGIQKMINTFERLIQNKDLSNSLKDKMNEFITQLKTRYPDDHDQRFGNEITITK